jgi:hypothetical protein
LLILSAPRLAPARLVGPKATSADELLSSRMPPFSITRSMRGAGFPLSLEEFSMCRSVSLACLVLVVLLTAGCSGKKEPPSVPVKGKVTLDGKDLPEGEITFIVFGHAPNIVPIKDGAYSGKAMVGKNRVEIRAYKQGPPLSTDPSGPPTKVNYVPDRYNGHTTLEADVTAGGANDFPFTVTSR